MRYEQLANFIDERMQMQHVYQPVMLSALLANNGQSSDEQIARELLSYDISQVEYYESITRNMVGRVLRRHRIVTRDRKTRTWHLEGFNELTADERAELIRKCKAQLSNFLQSRGEQPWHHRRKSTGYISGTLRYEVLKSAKFRCELCGVAADDKALEVDHIIPRNRGGTDDVSNLQALCYSCNAMKRDRDDTDFREVRRSYEVREPDCVFCQIPSNRIMAETELAMAIADAFPVTHDHTLVLPKRHVESYFELGRPEVNACNHLLQRCRRRVLESDPEVTGFNIGVNDGQTAGQTIPHCHIHLIPRRRGDVENPTGGVRAVIPGQADYRKPA